MLRDIVIGDSLTFTVPGRAQPAGSKRAFPFRKKDGRLGVAVSDANQNARGWKERVALVAAERYVARFGPRAPFDGAVSLDVEVRLARPKGHFGKRGLKVGARKFPTTKPDTTKLVRAIEDACTGILWVDDAQIVEQSARKVYAERDEVEIRVAEIA